MFGAPPTILSTERAVIADAYQPNSSSIDNLTRLGDWLYFSATDGKVGNELWRTNGTSTQLVSDINTDGNSDPQEFTALGDYLYFIADDGIHGRQIWRTSLGGATASQITDLQPALPYESTVVAFDSQIYFSRGSSFQAGNPGQLW